MGRRRNREELNAQILWPRPLTLVYITAIFFPLLLLSNVFKLLKKKNKYLLFKEQFPVTHSGGNLLWTRILEDWVMWTVFVFLAWTYVLWRFLIDSSGGWSKVFIPSPCPGKGCRDRLSILLGGHSTAGRWPRLTTSQGCLKQFSFHIHLVTGLFMCDFWWPWNWEMKRAGCRQEQCGHSSVCVPSLCQHTYSQRQLSRSCPQSSLWH